MPREPDNPPLRLSRSQVREIDRLAVERYAMPSIVLMENAARAVADVAYHGLARGGRNHVLLVCGGGNNGGDGLAVARHLHNLGVGVQIVLTSPTDRYTGDALINLKIVQAMKLPIWTDDPTRLPEAWSSFQLLIDALFGTGLTTPPRDTRWIDFINKQRAPVLSVDLPSGLDCDTGYPLGECVRARATVTFVAEKAGFANPRAKQYLGHIYVGDIGCPRELMQQTHD